MWSQLRRVCEVKGKWRGSSNRWCPSLLRRERPSCPLRHQPWVVWGQAARTGRRSAFWWAKKLTQRREWPACEEDWLLGTEENKIQEKIKCFSFFVCVHFYLRCHHSLFYSIVYFHIFQKKKKRFGCKIRIAVLHDCKNGAHSRGRQFCNSWSILGVWS